MVDRKSKIAIIGGGIGGLTTAIALRNKGFVPIVYERTPELKPVGAGIVLSTNAMNALRQLGLAEKVLNAGKSTQSYTIKTNQGVVLQNVDIRAYSQRFGYPSVGITRFNLHQILIDELPKNSIHLGKEFTSLQDFADDFDILIGADGLRSNIRKSLFGDTLLKYCNQTGWRGLAPIPENYDLTHAFEAWGVGKRFGAVQVSDKLLYWYAVINAPEDSFKTTSEEVKAIIKEQFNGWVDPVTELIESTNSQKIICDNIDISPPEKHWYQDNCVLLGDAIHSTTPDLGQGAGMAIESALVLAHCLDTYHSAEEAFKNYQNIRYPRTTWVTQKSGQLGRLAGIKNSALASIRNRIFKLGNQFVPKWIEKKQFSHLIGYQVDF